MKHTRFLTLGMVLFAQSCGQTNTLPPLKGPADGPSGAPIIAGGGGVTTDASGIKKHTKASPSNDPVVGQIKAYLAGKPISVSQAGKNEVCFSNLGSPCQGSFLGADGKARTLTATDSCDVAMADGKIELSIWDSADVNLYDVKVTGPDNYFPPPTVIADGTVKIEINKGCQL